MKHIHSIKKSLPNNPNKEKSIEGLRASPRLRILAQLDARRIEFITTAMVCVVFVICFAHVEYYYNKDPALQISNGKVLTTNPEIDSSRQVKPIIGNMYQYHLFPMLFIFILISLALFDDMTFKLFGARKRRKAFILGSASLITHILLEDFGWFVNRWLVPLGEDPKAGLLMQSTDWTSMHLGAIEINGFVIPN